MEDAYECIQKQRIHPPPTNKRTPIGFCFVYCTGVLEKEGSESTSTEFVRSRGLVLPSRDVGNGVEYTTCLSSACVSEGLFLYVKKQTNCPNAVSDLQTKAFQELPS